MLPGERPGIATAERSKFASSAGTWVSGHTTIAVSLRLAKLSPFRAQDPRVSLRPVHTFVCNSRQVLPKPSES